jgi:hypothetical protein
MANEVRSSLLIVCDDEKVVDEVLNFVHSDESDFDLNKIVPMPKELDITGLTQKERESRRESNKRKYGYADWYDWRWDKWGCKWNTNEVFINRERHLCFFTTPWNTPKPAILALSERFPDVAFELTYADEDFTNNCGFLVIQDGEVTDSEHPDSDTREAWDIVFQLWEEYKEDYELVDGNYVRKGA